MESPINDPCAESSETFNLSDQHLKASTSFETLKLSDKPQQGNFADDLPKHSDLVDCLVPKLSHHQNTQAQWLLKI